MNQDEPTARRLAPSVEACLQRADRMIRESRRLLERILGPGGAGRERSAAPPRRDDDARA